MIQTENLDYRLPEELIAQHPLPERDASRLLVVDRARNTLTDATMTHLPEFFAPHDLMVLNDTRVVPARIVTRRTTGGRIEGLFLRETGVGMWEVMLQGKGRIKVGERLHFERAPDASLELLQKEAGGRWRAKLHAEVSTEALLERAGDTPLPPYIHRQSDARDTQDWERYQTLFASSPGAVAAPTASLHFSEKLLADVRRREIETAFVTLHVGLGTFAPIKTEALSEHVMHAEWYDLPAQTAARIESTRKIGRKVIAVGTTVVRVLESRAAETGHPSPGDGWTNIFITPGFTFRAVDVLLTNFHLPKSTLLALVMAFAGEDLTRRAYAYAIESRYRFFSYGDAMLIL